MELRIQNDFKIFLDKNWRGGTLLLALSGGPDSFALFFLMHSLNLPFHIVHVDHGWREESKVEAETLNSLCNSYGYPFHCSRTNPSKLKGNLEDAARKYRLAFFKEVTDAIGSEAVLLGHHADDQAETILKRVLEGATLPKLKGLSPITQVEGVVLWRPLLSVCKAEILDYLTSFSQRPFIDVTNFDLKYLRARMRNQIIPYLSQLFGKNISSSLCRLGHAALELEEFVEAVLVPSRSHIEKDKNVLKLDFNKIAPRAIFEWKWVLRDFFSHAKVTISDATCKMLINHLKKPKVNKIIKLKGVLVHIHNKVLTAKVLPLQSRVEGES